MPSEARAAYSKSIAERRAGVSAGERRHRRLGYGQLATAAAAAVLVWASLARSGFSIAWVGIPIAVFTLLLVAHDRLLRDLDRRRRAVRSLNAGSPGSTAIGRAAAKRATAISTPLIPTRRIWISSEKGRCSNYSATARTHIGEDTLAGWLLAPAAADGRCASVIKAVEELRPRLDLREDLAVLAEEARTGVDPAALAAWGEAPPIAGPQRPGLDVGVFTALGVAALAAMLRSGLDWAGVVNVPAGMAIALRDFFLVGLLVNGFYSASAGKGDRGDRGRGGSRPRISSACIAEVLGAVGTGAVPYAAAGPAARRRWTSRASRHRSGWRGCSGWPSGWIRGTTCSCGCWRSLSCGRRGRRPRSRTGGAHSGPAVRRWLEAVGRDGGARARSRAMRSNIRRTRLRSSWTRAPWLEAEGIGASAAPGGSGGAE